MYQRQGNKNPNWKGGLPKCTDCAKVITRHTKYGRCLPCSRINPDYLVKAKDSHIGQTPWNKGMPNSTPSKEKHYKWDKGTSLNYKALHMYVKRRLGKPTWCSHCMSTVNVQWANASHQYKRELNDWIQLCVKCHRKYDYGYNSLRELFTDNERRIAT